MGSQGAIRVVRCNTRKWQGAIARCRKVRHADVARCEVVALHLAVFGNHTLRCSGVAPCGFSLTILRKSGGKGEVDANVLGVSAGSQDSFDEIYKFRVSKLQLEYG